MSRTASAPDHDPAPGPLVGVGRTADVYALPDGQVLRRYRDGSDATGELAVMRRLTTHGYPVPAAWPGPTRHDLVLEHLTGPTLAEAAATGSVSPEAVGGLLAALLHQLHAIPAAPAVSAPTAVGALGAPGPEHRVLHMDLHPQNVMLTPHGPVVIDWATATEGPPALDRAMSALILAQAAVSLPEFAAPARAALPPFLHRLGPVHPGALARAVQVRAANPTLTEPEVAALDAAVELLTRLA